MENGTKIDSGRLRGIIFPIVAAVSILTAFWAITDRPLGNHEAYVAVTAKTNGVIAATGLCRFLMASRDFRKHLCLTGL